MNFQSKIQNPNSKIITVLLIDDSPVALKILERILSTTHDIRVVGTAQNGKEGLDLIPRLKPDVISVDLHMPVMDGLEFTKECIARFPTPILAVSVSVQEGSLNIFKLLEAGALDVHAKPRSGAESGYNKSALELISKVRILSGVKVFRRTKEMPIVDFGFRISDLKSKTQISKSKIKIIAIGASTGGPQTLEAILPHLPANFPLPIICVQHIVDEFLEGFIEWFASICRMRVRIAGTGESPEPGTIYFPQAGMHLKIGSNGKLLYSDDPPYDGHIPSITITMKSLADYYGSRVVGILLTGMGRDGAEGMRAIKEAGGVTIAQNEATSIVFGMPKAAIELDTARYVLSPGEIAEVLMHI